MIAFFNGIAKHRNLTIRSQIQLLDTLAKVSLYDICYYGAASELMCKLVARGFFTEEASPSMVEFTTKYAKVALNVYFKSMKQKKE